MDRSDFERHPVEVAPGLLGASLESAVDGLRVRLRVTEVEAYAGAGDPAAHSHRGPTPRCATMFGRPGHLYVYRSHGIHWCGNVVVEPEGVGSAVLLRAGTVTVGEDVALARRGGRSNLADGPGKLCQALGIGGDHDGLDLLDPGSPIRLDAGVPVEWATSPRIGITKGVDLPWRFVAVREG